MGPETDWHLHFPVIPYWPQSRVSSCLCIHNCHSIILCLRLHLGSECPCHPCDPVTLGLWMEIWWAYYQFVVQLSNCQPFWVNAESVCGPTVSTVHCRINHICWQVDTLWIILLALSFTNDLISWQGLSCDEHFPCVCDPLGVWWMWPGSRPDWSRDDVLYQ